MIIFILNIHNMKINTELTSLISLQSKGVHLLYEANECFPGAKKGENGDQLQGIISSNTCSHRGV